MAKKKSKKKIVYSTISGTANQLINNRNATNANQSSSGVMFNTLKKGNPIRYTANERIAQRKQDAERKYNETIEKLKAKKEQESQQREAARQANAQIFTNSVNRMKTAQAQQSMGLGNPFMPAGTKTRPAGNGLTGNEKVLNDKKTIMNNFLSAQAKKLQEQQEAYQKELDKANASKVFRDNNGFKSTGTRTTGKGLTGNEKALDSKDAITNRFVDAQKQKQLREVGTTYGKGHEGYENVRNDLGGKFTPIAYEEWTRDKFAKGGNYDLGYNPYYMSDQGQIQRRDEWQNLSKEAKEQAEKEKQYNETNIQAAKPYDKWGNVFDVTKRMDDRERRNVAEWERFANDEDNGEGDEDSIFFEVDLPKKYGERGEDEDSSVFLTFEKGPNGTYQFTEATGTTTGKRYSREEIDDLLGYGDPNPTGRQDAIDKAEDLFLNHYDQEWWESKWNDPYNGEENREKLRADLYDYIMPDTYADRVSRMTPAQKTELDSAIDEMVEEASGIAQRRWDESDDAAWAEEAKARAYETKANEADAAAKEREEYNRLMAMTGDGMPSSEYDPSLAKATARSMQYQDAGETKIQTYYQLSGSENDRIYFLINNPDAPVADSNDIKLQAKLKFATPDMTKKFTELYKYDLENGTNTAGVFYKAIRGYLNDAYATEQDYITRAAAEDSSTAVGARLLTYPMQLAGGLAGGAETLRVAGAELSNNLFGTNYDTTPNMDMYALTQATQTIRDEQNQDIAEGLARVLTTNANGKVNEKQYQKWKDRGVFLMNTFDSIVDNMMSMYAAGGITGDKASKAGITLIQTMMSSEAISNTMLEKMDSGIKPGEAAWYAVGDGIIEWVTEKVSLEALLNPTVQTMLGDRKALTAYFLKAAGTEATEEMNADALNLGLDYLMSFLYEHENEITKRQDQLIVNGMDPEKALAQAWEEKLHQTGMSGLAGFISGAALSGGRIATNTFNQYLQGKQINANNQTEALIKAAQSNQVGPVSEGHANALEEKLLHGKKAKNTQVGKLSQAMQAEAMETLTSPDATDTDVGKSVRVLEALEEIRGNKEKTDAAKTGELWATQDSINEALRNGSKRITNGYEVIFDGKFAKLNKVVQDGKTGLKFEIETDNGTQTVDASALQATDFGIAAILRDVTATNKGLFSAGFVNTLLNVKQEGEVNNSGRLLMEATLLRLYAYADQRPPQNLSMPQKTAQALYDLSKSEHEANRAEQVRSNKGNVFKATLNGTIAYQSKTWNKWYGRLDQNARNQVDAIIGIAQRGNIEVSFNDLAEVAKINNISEEEAAKTYGWQLGNRIGINLAGEDVGTIEKQQVKNRHNMVISFAHEMTHWLQAHSLEGYNQLEKYVMDSLVKNNGMSQVSRMLNYYMANQGLNLEDAMSEVVANSCDQILMDESVQQHIQETNPGLYGEIKGFVKNLVQKLKNAMQNVDESASYESRNMMVYTNELAKRWLGAYDDALTAKIEKGQDKWDDEKEINGTNIRFSKGRKKSYSHIKENIKRVKPMLDAMDPVAKVPGVIDYEKYRARGAKGINAARVMWAEEQIENFGERYREEIGRFKIGKNRIGNAFAYYKPYNVGAISAFAAIPDVVEKGIIAERAYDTQSNKQVIESITFTAPVEINGERGDMGVAMHRIEGENTLEAYRIVLPDGSEFELSNQKEMEKALLRAWPSNDDGRKPSGTTSISNDIVAEKDQNDNTRKSTAQMERDIQTAEENGRVTLAGNEITDDARFSRLTEDAMDVNSWMMSQTPSSLQTEDEMTLVQAYKDLRINMSLSMKRISDYQAKIKQLEAKAQLTAEERDELIANRNRLEIQQKKLANYENELYKVTSSEGFAGMMYRQNMVLKDFIQGKTQDQVRQTVEDMLQQVQKAQEQMRKDTTALKKLAETQAVKTMRSFLGKSSLGEMATMLRKNYNSSMSKGEIMDRLAEISLKMASGMDVQSDTEVLAQDLLDKMRGIRSDALEQLRGTTLVIGQHLLNEIKAEHLTLKDLRAQLKGSGVTLKTEQNGRFVQTWNELRENNMGLPDVNDMSESDALHAVLDYIQNEVKNSRGTTQYDANLDEMATVVRAAAANVTTYLSGDAKARAQINNLMKQIAELSSKTEKTAESLEALTKQMDDVVLAGMKAKGWTTVLQRDVNDAIKYYNKTAKVAAETERTKVRKALIEQLRSENTKKLIQQQDKFMERIKSERKARELYQDNSAIRRKIDKTAKRISKRLFNETDKQNVPEEAKPLARKVMEMLVTHDSLFRKVMFLDEDSLMDAAQRLLKMKQSFGTFDEETDLNWLVIGEGDIADTTLRDKVSENLGKIYSGLMEYRQAEGERNKSLEDRKEALTKVENALNEIWAVIMARSSAFINGQRMQIRELAEMMEEDMQKSLYKGERRGIGSKIKNAATGALNYGNMTPEYFFKNLKNRVMNMIKQGLNGGENRYGLEAERSRQRVKQIAAETGYGTWDGQEVHDLKVANGKTVKATTEQIMALYATWLREKNQLRPEETSHLLKGGFVLTQNDQDKGKPRREKENNRPIRISEAQLNRLGSYLTDQQKAWVDAIVKYMSGELAELGNEASMKMYGIKRFTEQYYFPIRSWSGVLNSRSDAGVKNNNENRAAQQSFTKRIRAFANNAVQISDFTPTAMKHISGMITYNTIGPEVENLNKVLNQQLEYGEVSYRVDGEIEEDDRYKRNMRAAFQEAYGKQAYDYLTRFMKDLNGGITVDRTPFDRLLSVFKKNAVAGSLSVAAQQPLSYIRAAMMISPKYLAEAINPQYWKGSHAEMMKYSGLSVIKEMGKFDMNYGQTISDWITPEGKSTKAQKVWNTFNDKITSLPQMMDMMTWTRMWTAVKLEQMAQNKGADFNSDEFMQKVADRFNDLMRRTQVYDSVMVKSQNMRSTHWYAKTLTSFMAEPTLSLNVLEDAWANRKENGGKANVIRALATFMLSAAAQAGAKAFFGTGRSPDKKKNEEENFYYKFVYNLLSELNPLGLIPGYRQIIETMTDGELKDDAMGVIGKATEVVDNIWKLATTGKIGDRGLYRDLEDSVGQLLQLTTNVPAKNMMRDFRAMVNFFSGGAAEGLTGDTYAQRETSNAVLKYQLIDTLVSNDLIGMINKRLQEAGAGYKTTTGAYYDRIYNAEKAGNEQAAQDMRDYVILTSNAEDPEKTMGEKLRSLTKKDDSLTPQEKYSQLKEYGLTKGGDFILDEYEAGKLTRKDAEKLYRQENPKKTDKEVLEALDRRDWKNAGNDPEGYSNYTPLYEAIKSNRTLDINQAVDHMMDNGYTQKDIKGQLSNKYKQAYLDAKGADKTKLMDALTKAYKAIGLTANEALAIINGWKPKTK